jgi:hypothetical protein
VIQTDALISGGNSGGGAFNDEGQLMGVPTFGLAQDEQGQVLNGIRPLSVALPLIQEAREDPGISTFECPTCEEDDEEEADIPIVEEGRFSPTFSNYSFSTGVDAEGFGVDNVNPVPAGVVEFATFVDYTGMLDGVTWYYFCLHDSRGVDYGDPNTLTWSFGTDGTLYVFCFTQDGSAMPTGSYTIVIDVVDPNSGEALTAGQTTVSIQ